MYAEPFSFWRPSKGACGALKQHESTRSLVLRQRMSTSKARLEAVERAGLRCRELEEQLEMRQASLRAAQVEASSLEGQVAACESEQVTLQQQMRKQADGTVWLRVSSVAAE